MESSHPIMAATEADAVNAVTVLIIDDDHDIRMLIARVIRRIGHQTLEATDGRHGIDLFERHRDVIGCAVLDLYMPVFTGELTFHTLREAHRSLPIVLISGHHEDLARFALHDPLTVVLQKPFTVVELRETIQRLLGPKTLSVSAKTGV